MIFDFAVLSLVDVGPLFGETGLPTVEDVQQHHNECGYVASVMTLTDRSPEYVKSLLSFEGDYNSVSEVKVSVWTKNVDTPQMIQVPVALSDIHHRNDTKGDIWWPGALYQAPILAHIEIDPEGEGGMPSILPNFDEFWLEIEKVNLSPMVLQTKQDGCTTIWGAHAYAVTKAEVDYNGDKMIELLNTNGERSKSSAELVYHDTYITYNWVDYPSFVNEVAS
ncbi:uncharacterized protein L201_005706 [Kwoniella dendrophila CBS 6074]|uniref:Calpain catalytic domain-containing protein n=1 Tax=Kwoniella dendrophila CBS 6074 TaxID=1295534 RepID=A0AAX4K0T3_9TREE